ncbi:MAG: hypothetical protein RL249_580, partial [Actinomycetota bacterium]
PAILAAGSTPGVAKKMRKTKILIEVSTNTAALNRLIINDVTPHHAFAPLDQAHRALHHPIN